MRMEFKYYKKINLEPMYDLWCKHLILPYVSSQKMFEVNTED